MIDTEKLTYPTPTRIKEELGTIETEDDYHNHYAVSQSDLKLLEKNPRLFVEHKLKYERDENPYKDLNRHMKMGTMVEQSLLEPDRFEENFIEQSEMNTPSSPNQKEFVNLILSGEHDLYSAYRESYANFSESKAESLYDDLEDYIEFATKSETKGVYDQDEKETLLKVTGDILSHEKADQLLMNDTYADQSWNQLAVMGQIEDIICKGLIDRLVMKDGKFFLIDLKVTSKPLFSFGYWFVRRGYHRQFGMYTRLLHQYIKTEWDKDATIVPILIAASKEEPYDTIVREVPYDLMRQGGDEIDILLRRLGWHIESDNWDRRKDYYDQGIPDLQYNSSDILGVQV